MRTVDLEVASGAEAAAPRALARELRDLLVLGQVLAWAKARNPAARIVETIAQDEFTHDVVIALDDRRWLSFDVT